MSRKKLLTVIALCVGTPLSVFGQASGSIRIEKDARLEKIARSTLKKYDLPGLCVAVLEGDRRIRVAAVGVRKVGDTTRITPEDRFHIGSCTKAMTATVIACVVGETDLRWDSTVAEILPGLAERIHADYADVTLRQLLDHRGGIPPNSQFMHRTSKRLSRTKQRHQLLANALKKKPKRQPGTRYEYSNLGYVLATLMAETSAGQSWRELMQHYLFDPFGMESAGFGPPATGESIEAPWGHRRNRSKHVPVDVDNPPVIGPVGRVHCSFADWARFAALHLGHLPKGERSAPKTLTKSTIRFLQRPLAENEYAFGWIIAKRSWAKGTALSHSGSNSFWYATIWVAPKLDRALLVATNTGQQNAATACDAAIGDMVRQFLSKR